MRSVSPVGLIPVVPPITGVGVGVPVPVVVVVVVVLPAALEKANQERKDRSKTR